jgi:hypothetical protein
MRQKRRGDQGKEGIVPEVSLNGKMAAVPVQGPVHARKLLFGLGCSAERPIRAGRTTGPIDGDGMELPGRERQAECRMGSWAWLNGRR